LVIEQARHGYEIEQVIEARDMREWTEIGFSSIYYLLKKLEKHGWVRSRIDAESQQGPARTVYEATPAGFAAWQTAMIEVLAVPRPHYDPFQLGLSNLPAVPPNDALSALEQRRESLQQTLDRVRNRRAAAQPYAPLHVDAMFELSMMQLETELRWLTAFIARLRNTGDQSNEH
jgi:DNA-binding PadR family transcriptional regulator